VNRFVAYDVTRLLARYAVSTPNGIDRIDLAYARHFLTERGKASAGVYMQGLQPALLDRKTLAALLIAIDDNWETGGDATVSGYQRVKDFLRGTLPAAPENTLRRARPPALAARLAPLRLLRPRGLRRALFERIPIGAAFIHSTHYPAAHLFRWLRRRPDVKPVFFIHDLLPLQFPEYFGLRHIAEHRRSLEIFAQYGGAAIVNTRVIKHQLKAFLSDRGWHDVPVLVKPIPPDPIFSSPGNIDPDLANIPYFVVCGTIEPRKNHLLLLQVWRELSRQCGEQTPKLVIIGRRGWENENVVDLLDRSHEIRRHAIEIDGLSTIGVARLMAGARAVLMPSFAEGYGLPVIEAQAVGVPVIAADIPVFREVAPGATFRSPLDGVGWLKAIQSYRQRPASAPPFTNICGTAGDYFTAVEAFIHSL
jgi:glycosyltransferase involved in cell wall biosynthesis